MNKDEFRKLIIEKIDAESVVYANTELLAIDEWDSIAVINILSMFKHYFNVIITPDAINNCDTIEDLVKLADGYFQ